jgi:hypothetical protein
MDEVKPCPSSASSVPLVFQKDFYECAVEAICASPAATAPILSNAVLTFSGS